MVSRKLEPQHKEYFLIFPVCFGRCTGQIELVVQKGIAHLCNFSDARVIDPAKQREFLPLRNLQFVMQIKGRHMYPFQNLLLAHPGNRHT